MADPASSLYRQPLSATRSGPLYNAFSYPTKIAAESVALFIACHTRPGDRVLDAFGGSGTTGVAALLCERPTAGMLSMAEANGLDPVWGARDATIYELSEIGSLLARGLTAPPAPGAFAEAASRVLHAAEAAANNLYATSDAEGRPGQIRHIIWSDVVQCPSCSQTSTYADVRVLCEPQRFADRHACGACGHESSTESWRRVTEQFQDQALGIEITRRARVPWRVYGRGDTGTWVRSAVPEDHVIACDIESQALLAESPVQELVWGDLHRGGYHLGMSHLHHLYTSRNFRAMGHLWAAVEQEEAELRDALRLFVLSYNASHATLMTRVVLKRDSSDFILTGAQSGVMYVSGLPVEKNVFAGLKRKVKVFSEAFALTHGASGQVDVITGSSTCMNELKDGSVQYVFTDPPFGAYIPYSEINQLNELWLGRPTDRTNEAIVSPAQGKGVGAYADLLLAAFKETQRVMAAGAEMTLVFHSSQADVWQALASSLASAGFEVVEASSLDKVQPSFKQVNGHVAVSGDPLLRLRRSADGVLGSAEVKTYDGSRQEAGIASGQRARERAYAAYVADAFVDGRPVALDAKAFYAGLGSGQP